MPYRIELHNPPDDALDRLVELGALDVAQVAGGIAAIVPDSVDADSLASALHRQIRDLNVTPARGRDDGSVWVVHPQTVRVGRLEIIPAELTPKAGALRMIDGQAFGTGLHVTTELCLEALHNELSARPLNSLLDVGTGSGVLALAALLAGVPRVVAVDIDAEAVRVSAENARLNGLRARLALVHGGPEAVAGRFPLVLANVLTASLVAMAPTLTRRLERSGRLVLSGIRSSLAGDVEQAYRRVGMRQVYMRSRDGWSALTLQATW